MEQRSHLIYPLYIKGKSMVSDPFDLRDIINVMIRN